MRETKLPLTLRCLNPTCTKTCTFEPSHRGRQPRFCSPRCRARYSHTRTALERRLHELGVEGLAGRHHTRDEQRRRQIAHIRWLLVRYQAAD